MAKRLTSDEIRAKNFTTTRLREGFAIEEVESFLNEIERTVRAHEKDIKDLRSVQERATSDASKGSADPAVVAHLEAQINELKKKNKELEGFKKWVEDTTASMGGSLKAFASSDPDKDGGDKEAFYQNKIETLEAHLQEASEELRTQDRKKATRIIDMAQTNAAQVIDDAEKEAERIIHEAKAHAQEEVSSLEAQKKALVRANNELAELESENRERLMLFYTNNLEQIERTELVEAAPLSLIMGAPEDDQGYPVENPSEAARTAPEGAEANDVTINDWKPPAVDDVPAEKSTRKEEPEPVEEEDDLSSYGPPVQQFPSFFESQNSTDK